MNEYTLIRLNEYPDEKEIGDIVRQIGLSDTFSSTVNILKSDKAEFTRLFPDGDFEFFKKSLEDEFVSYGETDDDSMTFLTKAFVPGVVEPQIGMVTKDDIRLAINEYDRLFKAGFASPAEILTLARYFPENPTYQAAAGALTNKEPLVVGGPASVEMVDREGHFITMKAMRKAFINYMKSHRTRNIMVLHSDVQTGWALPAYINANGQIFKSGVDSKKFFLISELRDDNPIAKRTAEQIREGRIRSYSIAGSAINVEKAQINGAEANKVNELSLVEVTLCERGVNQGANFDILKGHGSGCCADGSCLVGGDKHKEQVEMGTKTEAKEHDLNEGEAAKVAEDHLEEIPDYYDRLKVMEKLQKAGPIINKPGLRWDPLKHRYVKINPKKKGEEKKTVSKLSIFKEWLSKEGPTATDPEIKYNKERDEKTTEVASAGQPKSVPKDGGERKFTRDPASAPAFASGDGKAPADKKSTAELKKSEDCCK